MQKFTPKYTIVTLLEDKPEGSEFASNNWPLHVTIADTFAADWQNKNLLEKLTLFASDHQPVTAVAAHDEYFGPEQKTQVTILGKTEELGKLHNELIALLEEAGATFNSPEYNKAGFRAHSTVQLHARLFEEEVVNFDNLTVIDMFPDEDPYRRKVIRNLRLGGK